MTRHSGLLASAAVAVSSMSLMIAAPAMADVRAGVDAWTAGDYPKAIAEWQGPADRGDADAQFNMGQAYRLGRGVTQNVAKAEELFGKAAAQGHPQAADNYGLMLFQRGERQRALPYIQTAAGRGDPRSQYLLGIAHFNGDMVAKDWVRAYALMSLAQQAGLSQATTALAQMDQHISLEQRQQSVSLASELSAQAEANRARQLATADLQAGAPRPASAGTGAGASAPRPASPPLASAGNSPATAGADYARPRASVLPTPAARPTATPVAARPTAARPVPAPVTAAAAPSGNGPWRIQLGAFGVAGNAEALWARVRTRPELAGRARILAPSGKVTRLLAGGFATQGDAQAACSRLSAGGFSCLPTRN